MFNIPLDVPLMGSGYIVVLEGLGIKENVSSVDVKPRVMK